MNCLGIQKRGQEMLIVQLFIIILFTALLTPCISNANGQDTTSTLNLLAGTSWRLVEFLSMDDAVWAVRPEDPAMYTMSLNDDGTFTMRLNCNRAGGNWSATPAGGRKSGKFEFSRIAMTRALCRPRASTKVSQRRPNTSVPS